MGRLATAEPCPFFSALAYDFGHVFKFDPRGAFPYIPVPNLAAFKCSTWLSQPPGVELPCRVRPSVCLSVKNGFWMIPKICWMRCNELSADDALWETLDFDLSRTCLAISAAHAGQSTPSSRTSVWIELLASPRRWLCEMSTNPDPKKTLMIRTSVLVFNLFNKQVFPSDFFNIMQNYPKIQV